MAKKKDKEKAKSKKKDKAVGVESTAKVKAKIKGKKKGEAKAERALPPVPVAPKPDVKPKKAKKPAAVAAPAVAADTAPAAAKTDLLLGISRVYRLSMAHLQQALKDENISASQWEILSALSASTPVTQQVLAKELYVSEGNITQMLAKLESLGWIERRREWRTNYVTLSAAGQALQKKVSRIYAKAGAAFFDGLSDAERARTDDILKRLVASATAEN